MGRTRRLLPGCAVMELVDFNLRGGEEALHVAATRVGRVTERYLTRVRVHDITVVVTEIVAWLARGDPEPHTLRLDLSVTSAAVRVSVTAAQRTPLAPGRASSELLRDALPVTAALSSRYGLEASRRTRVWAEFERPETPASVESDSQHPWESAHEMIRTVRFAVSDGVEGAPSFAVTVVVKRGAPRRGATAARVSRR